MSDWAIETHDLRKEYKGGVLALKDLSIRIAHGSCVGFLGPNGAGKTTTIKILTNLIEPTSGQAFIEGIDVVRHPKEALRHVDSLVEVPGMPDYLTPHEMLSYFGKVRGMSTDTIHRRIKEVLATVKLSDWEHKKIGSFSTGMTRRLAIGKALLHDPDILIMDEPVIGLDPKGMRDIRDIIKATVKEGKTVFLSSHLLGEVAETCTEVMLLEKGAVVSSGTVAELTGRMLNRGVEVTFLRPPTEPELARVRALDRVKGLEPAGARAHLLFDGTPEAGAAILGELVSMGLGVTAFTPVQATLEDVYVSVMGDEAGVN
jgi:ABC-2 type transport system ATP-binding protein